MLIYERARELAELILDMEEGKRVTAARLAFDNDMEARKKLSDFNAYKNDVQKKVQNGEIPDEDIDKIFEDLKQRTIEMQKDPIIGELIRAEAEMADIANKVLHVFSATLDGIKEDEDCGGCCEGCGGCK